MLFFLSYTYLNFYMIPVSVVLIPSNVNGSSKLESDEYSFLVTIAKFKGALLPLYPFSIVRLFDLFLLQV